MIRKGNSSGVSSGGISLRQSSRNLIDAKESQRKCGSRYGGVIAENVPAASFTLLMGWFIGQTLELAIAGAVVGSGLAGMRLRHGPMDSP
jgi:hypothetical protein